MISKIKEFIEAKKNAKQNNLTSFIFDEKTYVLVDKNINGKVIQVYLYDGTIKEIENG